MQKWSYGNHPMWLIINKHLRMIAISVYKLTLKMCFLFLELIISKNRNYWCFCTWKGYWHTMDNPRAIFEVVKNNPDITKIILQKDKGADLTSGVNVKFIEAESFKGVYYTACSKVILLGYSLSGLSSYGSLLTTRHSIIQLWHGIPLKRIGMLFPEETFWSKETARYSATVCSSKCDKNFMKQAFAPIPENRVWQCGLPRNDTILIDEKYLAEDYLSMLQELRDRINGRKLVLYAPTWRIEIANRYNFSENELGQLNELLKTYNAVFAIRGHSNTRAHQLIDLESGETRIIDVNNVPDVNILLRLTDILITDYSSIYIDFLITERPILHFTYDLDQYYKERGFLYDIETAFASEESLNFSQLLSKLEAALSGGISDANRYRRAKELFHDHVENSSSCVVENIKEIS